MSRLMIAALCGALALSACTTSTETVVSSRNYYEPVFVPEFAGPF